MAPTKTNLVNASTFFNQLISGRRNHKVGLAICGLVLLATSGLAQSTLRIEYNPLFGYTSNIYGAPSDKPLTGPDSLFADTLSVNDIWLQNAVRFDFNFKDEKHAVRWENNVEVRCYFNNPAANTNAFSSSLKYLYEAESDGIFGTNVSLGKADQLYVDLITTDLLLPFDRNYLNLDLYAGKKADNHTFLGRFSYNRDRFEACLACDYEEVIPSLSNNEWGVAVEDTIYLGPSNRQQKFVVSVGWRNRRYSEWANTQLLNPAFGEPGASQFSPFVSTENYATHHWRFVDAQISYHFPLNEKSVIIPYLNYQNRFDVGNSDYSRQDFQAGMRLKWEQRKVKLNGGGGFINQRFENRLASNEGVEGGELLRYTLLNVHLNGHYMLAKRVGITLGGNFQQRTSNNTNELSIRRKSFDRWMVYGGIEFLINTSRSGK